MQPGYPARDIRSCTTPELRSKWGARLRKYREDRERMRGRGRDLQPIDQKIAALKKKLDVLEQKGGD